jgi:hypothetical protein
MGGSQSRAGSGEGHGRQSIETPAAYYGNRESEVDPKQIRATIRDLHLVRVQRSLDKTRRVRIHSMISITDNCGIIAYGPLVMFTIQLRLDAPCEFVCVGGGVMNAMTFPAVHDPINVIIPIPVVDGNFQVEIVPDLQHAETEIMEGFIPVTRHLLLFRFADDRYEFLEHRLTAQRETFHLDVLKICEKVVKEPAELCIVCEQNDASEALAECGHKLLCEGCKLHRMPRFHHCPVCGSVPPSG